LVFETLMVCVLRERARNEREREREREEGKALERVRVAGGVVVAGNTKQDFLR